MKKVILCYGDSNTWGYVPQTYTDQSVTISRYSENKRWPKLLQKKLGSHYVVIEEGLNGRTTNLNYSIPPDRNGKTYLLPCLYSHAPIDLVVFALGGNDMKSIYNRTPKAIFNGLMELGSIVEQSKYGRKFLEAPKVLYISPLIPLKKGEEISYEDGDNVFKGIVEKSKKLSTIIKEKIENNFYFLDLGMKVRPSKIDGLHLDEDGHEKMATLVYKKILSMDL